MIITIFMKDNSKQVIRPDDLRFGSDKNGFRLHPDRLKTICDDLAKDVGGGNYLRHTVG